MEGECLYGDSYVDYDGSHAIAECRSTAIVAGIVVEEPDIENGGTVIERYDFCARHLVAAAIEISEDPGFMKPLEMVS